MTKKEYNKSMSTKIDEKVLGDLLGGIVALADKERKESDSYKDLFKGSNDMESLLRSLDFKMTDHVLNATKILGEKYGYNELSREKKDEIFWILMALPFLIRQTTKYIERTQGSACCVDKAYYHVAAEIKELLNGES